MIIRGIAKSMSYCMSEIHLTTLGQFFDLHISIFNTRVEASSRRVPKENFQFDFISEEEGYRHNRDQFDNKQKARS